MRKPKHSIKLSTDEKNDLQKITKKHSTGQSLLRRCLIILMVNSGMLYQDIASSLGVQNSVVTKWTSRWIEKENMPIIE